MQFDLAAVQELLAHGDSLPDGEVLVAWLREACQLAQDKERDALLAAEIGQSLLTSNTDLQAECDMLKEKLKKIDEEGLTSGEKTKQAAHASNAQDDQHLLHLEKANADLQREADQLREKVHDLHSTHSKHVKASAEELRLARKELDTASAALEKSRKEVERLMKEKQAWTEEQRKWRDRNAEESSVLSNVVADLEEQLARSEQQRIAMEKHLEELQAEFAHLKERTSGWEDKAQEYNELKDMCEQQATELCECKESLTEAHEAVQALTGQLEIFLAKQESDQAPDAGNKTLFSEVEDRRLMLESEHSHLSQRHEGLRRAHLASVQQQSRMKNHISRLTQLTLNQSAGDKLKRLETTIGQLQNENRDLLAQVAMLERQLEEQNGAPAVVLASQSKTSDGGAGAADSDVVACLQLRFEQLTSECDQLRKQLRTANMMRSNEIERSRQYETTLAERERELDGLRSAHAQLRFELEELRQNIKQQPTSDGNDASNDISEAIGHEESDDDTSERPATSQGGDVLPNDLRTSPTFDTLLPPPPPPIVSIADVLRESDEEEQESPCFEEDQNGDPQEDQYAPMKDHVSNDSITIDDENETSNARPPAKRPPPPSTEQQHGPKVVRVRREQVQNCDQQ